MTPYVPDYFADVVAKTATAYGSPIYFDFGHYEDVTGRQQKKAGATNEATKRRYPLIWLVMDFEEDRTALDLYASVSPMIIIAANTEMNYSMKERRDRTFLPVLYPIYDEFLRQIKQSKAFKFPPVLPHTKIDRPYWKGEGGSTGNLFNDAIDAIQIKDLKLQIASNIFC